MRLSRDSFRKDPWLLYVPLWAQWTILNFAGPGAWIGPTVLTQLLQGPRTDVNVIFPVTWLSAVTSFAIISFLLPQRTSILNSLAVAAASQFGSAFLYEFVFSLIALLRYGHPILQGNTYYVIVGISWLAMLFGGIGYWTRNNVLYTSLVVFILGFLVWILIGFPILEGALSLFLNYLTKIAAFFITTSLYIPHSTWTCTPKPK
jgi:hypothetical protein